MKLTAVCFGSKMAGRSKLLLCMEKPLTDEIYLSDVDRNLMQGKRNTNMLIMLLAIACVALGCGIFYYTGLQPHLVRLCSFLLLGFVFASALQKKAATKNFNAAPLMLAVCIQAVVAGFSFLTARFELFSNLAFFAAFLLPIVVVLAWQQFLAIPRKLPRTWTYSHDLPAQSPFVYSENRPVHFKITTEDKTVVVLKSTAPRQIKLGMAFYYSVQAQEERSGIRFINALGQPYEWLFYTLSFGQKKYLDPEESLYENRVSNNTTIVAECIC